MTRTTSVTRSFVAVFFLISTTCSTGDDSYARRECRATEISAAVGVAVTTGDATVLLPTLIDTRDLTHLQNAPYLERSASFESNVYREISDDVDAWAAICKGGMVRSVMAGKERRNRTMEGFAVPLNTIEGSVVRVWIRDHEVAVPIQTLFSSRGCWRLVELGKPDE